MRRVALLAVLALGACVGGEVLDARMKPMVGTGEPALVAAMSRPPDDSYETSSGAKVLQWRWQRQYAMADRMLGYSYGGGTYRPIANTGTGTVRDACLTEWTIENGVAARYRFEGNDCSVATAQRDAP